MTLAMRRCALPLIVAGCLVAAAFTAGCGGSGSSQQTVATVAAGGKVLNADGQPMTGGMVEFHPSSGTGESPKGVIGSDGTFKLRTLSGKEGVDGAPAGTYTCIVTPGYTGDQTTQEAPDAIEISGTFTVNATGPNEFTIQLPAQ
ncbi:MAG: hypothetical protein HYS13_03235 [Planctomycetia bacterium]|nr:hypothetical protein [Planctomycetia bacterium]